MVDENFPDRLEWVGRVAAVVALAIPLTALVSLCVAGALWLFYGRNREAGQVAFAGILFGGLSAAAWILIGPTL